MNPLDGPREKVEMAKRNIQSLSDATTRWFRANPCAGIPAEFDADEGTYSLRINYFVPPPEVLFAVRVGGIAYDLRSALDQLACELAISINAGVDQETTGFPITLRGPRARRVRGQRDDRFNPKRLGQTLRGFVARIERLQPYKGGNGGVKSPLWMLHELNNFDKHRRIALSWVSVGSIAMRPPRGWRGQEIHVRRVSLTAGVPLINGAKVGSTADPDVQMEFPITPRVVFGDRCAAVAGQRVFDTLTKMADEVHRIVELFAGDFPD